MRALAASLLTALEGENPAIVHLIEIQTGLASTPTLRYCSRPYDLVWSGQTWTGRAGFDPGEIRVESQDNADGPTIELSDTDQVFRALLAAGAPFVWQDVVIRMTVEELCTTGAADDTALRDDFLCDGWELPEGKVRLQLKPFAAVYDTLLPRTTLSRVDFPGIPRDATYL